MSFLLYGGIAVIVIGLMVGLFLYRKKDARNVAVGLTMVIGVMMLFGEFAGLGLTTVPSGGVGTGAGVSVVEGAKPIGTLTVKLQEAESNDWGTADATLRFYAKDVDISRDSDKNLDNVVVTNGAGSKALSGISSGTDYRVGLDGSTTYYDQDFGVVYLVAPTNVTTSTVDVTVRIGDSPSGLSKPQSKGMQLVGTIDDILDEAKHDSTGGDTNYSLNGSNELKVGGTDVLDINRGATGTNGQVKLRVTLGCSGSNAICKKYTFGFDKNADALCEGDEISSFTSQLYTGTDLGLKADLLTAWKNEQGIVLGDLKGGTLGTYDLTIGLNTAQITSGADSFKMCGDDLGTANNPVDQKDTWLSTKATKDCTTITMNGVA